MLPFDRVFNDVARREACVLALQDAASSTLGTLLFREFYCSDRGCDCRRVVLHAHWVEQQRVVASIGYGFEPAAPPFDDEPQVMLDPLNPQSELSEQILRLFEEVVERDADIRAAFVRHYEQWKRVVDDPSHPDHAKLRPPIPPNQRCPCRSGKKFKNCCGRPEAGDASSAP